MDRNSNNYAHMHICSIIRLGIHTTFFFQYFKLKAKMVDRDGVLTGIVLQDASKERLGEVKP